MQSDTQLVTGGNNSAASVESLRDPGDWEASSWGWGRLPLGGTHRNSAAVPKRKQDPVIKEKGGNPCRRESWYKASDKKSRLISEWLCECFMLHGTRAWSRASIGTRSPKSGDNRSGASGPWCPFLAWGPWGQDREHLLTFLASQGARPAWWMSQQVSAGQASEEKESSLKWALHCWGPRDGSVRTACGPPAAYGAPEGRLALRPLHRYVARSTLLLTEHALK